MRNQKTNEIRLLEKIEKLEIVVKAVKKAVKENKRIRISSQAPVGKAASISASLDKTSKLKQVCAGMIANNIMKEEKLLSSEMKRLENFYLSSVDSLMRRINERRI